MCPITSEEHSLSDCRTSYPQAPSVYDLTGDIVQRCNQCRCQPVTELRYQGTSHSTHSTRLHGQCKKPCHLYTHKLHIKHVLWHGIFTTGSAIGNLHPHTHATGTYCLPCKQCELHERHILSSIRSYMINSQGNSKRLQGTLIKPLIY